MKAKAKYGFILLLTTILISCSKKPQPISYGLDPCAFCKMTITDPRYGSELISKKGKIYKFDSIECMADFVSSGEVPGENIFQMLIPDFPMAPEFTDALAAQYLVSENLPSPMGANLTGFANKQDAEKMHSEKGGQLFTWAELNEYLSQRKK